MENKSLTGKQFHQLLVLQSAGFPEQWLCRCTCGNTLMVSTRDLLGDRKKSCGCLKRAMHGSDITGMRSGKLVALEPTKEKRRGATLWRCRCDCGSEIFTEAYKIRSGNIRSCGCTRTEKKIKDITGQRFGRLVAIQRLEKKRGNSFLWQCRCDCGNEVEVSVNALLSGNSKSCGCKRVDSVRKNMEQHGTVADHARLIDGTNVDLIEKKGLRKNNTSGHTGVQARGNKWIAVITFKKKVYYLGIYQKLEDAVRVRKQAEERLFGEFLEWYYDNFPPKGNNQTENKGTASFE